MQSIKVTKSVGAVFIDCKKCNPNCPLQQRIKKNPDVVMCRGLGDACPAQSGSCDTTFLCLSCLFHMMKQGKKILLNFLLVLRYLFSEQYIRLLLLGFINSVVTTIFPT